MKVCSYSIKMEYRAYFNLSQSGKALFFMISLWLTGWTVLHAQTETLSSGAFIVNMGVTPQTVANGLKPYGMVYDLVRNYVVPVKWVVNPSKVKDGTDFSYNGVDYKGGPFIIPAEYRSATVNARITYWQGQGVQGVTTTAPITVPVLTTLRAMPVWTLDDQNGSIAQSYLTNAGIPATAYNWLSPQQLTCCNDLFAMPHADPTWPTHSNLYTWNLNCDGAIWLACHAGSAEEDLFNPANKPQQMNFLSQKSGNAVGGGPYEENALILWGNHDDGTPPYSYAYPADPFMQFMGIIDLATQNGSEQIYLPKVGWNPGAKVYVWDPDHPEVPSLSPGPAAVCVSGRAFDDPLRGRVMAEAAHSHAKASAPANVAAQRIFFNFSYFSMNEKAVIPDISLIPDTMYSGLGQLLTYHLPPGVDSSTYTTLWSADCGGTFSPNATTKTVVYTPPAVANPTTCYVKVQITDACGRKFNDSKPVVILCAVSASHTTTNPSCNGSVNGSIAMTLTGGSTPYSWNWSRVSPAGTGSGTGSTITGLAAGTYNVTVTASGGCSATFSATLTQPAVLTASTSHTNISCNGAATGAINLTAAGGTTPYAYSWTGGITTEDRSGLVAGTYNVTVTDSKGCTTTASATLTQPTAIVLTPTPTHINCFGQSTGAINLAASGGTGAFTFAWSDGPTTQNRSGLAAGTYVVTATDGNACTKTASVTLTQPTAALSLSTSVTHIVCGAGSGAINLTASGGTSPYTFNWGGGVTTEDRSGLTAGTYTVTATDNKGCTATTSATVTSTSGASLSTSVTNIPCFGQTGAINLTVTGVGPFTYAWGDGATTEDRTGLSSGTYSVTVTSSEGCSATTTASVTGPSAPLSLSASMTNVSCNGGSNGSIDLTVTGGTMNYTYAWSDGPAVSQDRSGLSSGTYTVTVTDANGCTAVLVKTITQPDAINLSVAVTHPTCPAPTADGAIDLTASGGSGGYIYDWADVPGSINSEDRSGLTAGTYSVTVTDSNGCSAMISATLTALNPLPAPPSGVNH